MFNKINTTEHKEILLIIVPNIYMEFAVLRDEERKKGEDKQYGGVIHM